MQFCHYFNSLLSLLGTKKVTTTDVG